MPEYPSRAALGPQAAGDAPRQPDSGLDAPETGPAGSGHGDYNRSFGTQGSEEGSVMARGINKVILIGNLGADPETRSMPSGMTVANIRVATSESWKDKQSGENKERTEWHQVALFGRLGEIAGEYLRKGSKVYIEGS